MNLLDQLLQDPEQQSALMAQILRSRARSGQLEGASIDANRLNNLAAITQMANNPAAAAAAKMAASNQQKQFSPVQMGQQGFALPGSGEFVSSPMYEDEKADQRQQQRRLLEQSIEARREQARMLEEGRNQRAQDQALLRMTLAAMRGSGGGGQTDKPKTAEELKQEAKAREEQIAQEGVTATVERLRGLYGQLNQFGGIQSTQRPALENIISRARSSVLGQSLGNIMGTPEQNVRSEIQATIPILMTDIKNSGKIGTGSMNSNIELQFYLAAATDVTRPVEANLSALRFIDQKFGTGRLSQTPPSPQEVQSQQSLQQELNRRMLQAQPQQSQLVPAQRPAMRYLPPSGSQ